MMMIVVYSSVQMRMILSLGVVAMLVGVQGVWVMTGGAMVMLHEVD